MAPAEPTCPGTVGDVERTLRRWPRQRRRRALHEHLVAHANADVVGIDLVAGVEEKARPLGPRLPREPAVAEQVEQVWPGCLLIRVGVVRVLAARAVRKAQAVAARRERAHEQPRRTAIR